ncbi:MAG TPA: methyltransferase domain-containing protein [Acidimicrobiales bacterium]|nr:methyltransferase domain-containing protein [Acidimicrobiales bacterium]
MADTYTHGHHDSVLRSHRWRTAENSAAYLLAHLRAGQDLLDVGCGPGTITVDLATRVRPGRVVGVDRAEPVLAEARGRIGAGDGRVRFAVGDVYALEFGDASFDVVHAHQVLQHLTDPVAAIREMARVLRPGGVLAARDSDYGGFVWAPGDERLDRWMALYHDVTAHNGAQADAGRHLLGWAQQAGCRDVAATSSTWTFADPPSRRWWADLWAERVQRSDFASQALEYGMSDPGELASIADAWRRWAAAPDGVFVVTHGEIIARPGPEGRVRDV